MPECPCGTPLGHDSIDSGWTVCHVCRKCPRCQQAVSLTEATYCIEREVPIKHARCMIVDDSTIVKLKATPEDFVQLVNMVHLLPYNLLREGLETMTFDQQFGFLQDMQRITAETSILIGRGKKEFDERLRRAEAPPKITKKREAEVEAQSATLPSAKGKKSKLDKFCDSLASMGIARVDAEIIFKNQQGKVQ